MWQYDGCIPLINNADLNFPLMKKQTAHKPNDQKVISNNTPSLPTVPPSAEPVANGTKVKSNDGGYIWIV